MLVEADAKHDIITAGSNFCGSHDDTTDAGVACSHAYSILATYNLLNADNTVHARLLKVRNPWGAEQYGGDWSDSSTKWTPEFTDQVNTLGPGDRKVNNEGLFYMDIDSYMVNFSMSSINKDTHHWNLDYFLMLDDQQTESTTSSNPHC
jgi:calpain-15